MTICGKKCIPKRLHWNNKPVNNNFYTYHLLFRRSPKEFSNPFESISLADISTNWSKYSHAEDVLLNTMEDESDCYYKKMEIQWVFVNIFPKTFISNTGSEKLYVKLSHEPEICNYSHVEFKLLHNDKLIDNNNWPDSSLKKRKGECKEIRNNYRTFLFSSFKNYNNNLSGRVLLFTGQIRLFFFNIIRPFLVRFQ